MKSLFFFCLVLFCCTIFSFEKVTAQAPQSFKYQAIARNSSGTILGNQNVGFKISLLQGGNTGTAVYSEEHNATTNAIGLVNLEIGNGTNTIGVFANINWASGPYFVKIQFDATGGTTYSDMGTTQLLSVPYALFAASGNTGPQGPPGTNGQQGIQGVPGNAGIDGLTILNGDTDPISEGSDGDFYINTSTKTIFGPKTNSVWGVGTSLIGPSGENGLNGTNGLDGKTVLNGTIDPAMGIGVVGDFYINTTSATIFGPKTSGTWGSGTSLIGPAGTYTNGTGINLTGGVISNTAPDQTINLTGNGATTVTGTYPNFTISSMDNNTTYNSGTGLTLNGTTFNSTWTASGNNIYNNNTAFVGIGTTNPTTALHVNGTFRLTDDTEGSGKFLTSDAFGNASWQSPVTPAIGTSTGTANYIPKFIASNSLGNSEMYQSGTRIGVGTTSPTGKFQIQQDASAADSEPIFEVKDKTGQTVMVVYKDSTHFFVNDPGGAKTSNRGSFAVSGKSQTKAFTNDFLRVNPDSTRIYTTDTLTGFGVQNLTGNSKKSYLQLMPNNYFIGHESGKSITSGLYNCFIGYQAGKLNTVGYSNIFIGYKAGFNNINGHENISLGVSSLFTNSSGNFNTALGTQTLYSNTSGSWNTASGYQSMYFNTTGIYNCAYGYKALFSNLTGGDNTSIGFQSLYFNTNGSLNAAIGYQALYKNTSGYSNVANGNQALYSNTTGAFNVASGYQALYSNTTANDNVAIGDYALFANVTGYYNVATGSNALDNNTTGTFNSSYGKSSLNNNTSGHYNVAVGAYALDSNLLGSYNAAIGTYALRWNKYDLNTAVGYAANATSKFFSNTTALGAQSVITASNQVRIGDQYVTSIGGFANWTNVSDKRFKKNIQKNVPGLDFIMKLEPVTYYLDMENIAKLLNIPDTLRNNKSKLEPENILQTGFIAQDVEKAANELGFDFSGVDKPKNNKDFYGLRYAEFTVPLVKAVQELNSKNLYLQEMNSELKVGYTNQQKQIDKLNEENQNMKKEIEKIKELIGLKNK